MTDNHPPILPGASQKLKPSSRRQYRLSDDHSPTRTRITDDLLSQLTPVSAVDVLRHPTPSLKACLDASTANEQDFAMQTALASQKIYEWLDELTEWPWPAFGGSGGFELPIAKRRKPLPPPESQSPEDAGFHDRELPQQTYLGSLPANDVFRYEERIDEIAQDLEELEIDDIKAHVMSNHILPLSRPGTPLSDSNRSTLSMSSYNKLDDLAAVMTAIVIQALPNLSKLSRLLNVWKTRLSVLRGIPSLLSAIADAEIALQSGWNVILAPEHRAQSGEDTGDDKENPALTKQDFEVMRLVVQKKITRPGRSMDAMLDSLEGSPDTLPDDWITRMDDLERDYAAWHVACEQRIRDADLAKVASVKGRSSAAFDISRSQSEAIVPAPRAELVGGDEHRGSRHTQVPITVEPPPDNTTKSEAARVSDGDDDGATLAARQQAETEVHHPKTPVKQSHLGAGLQSTTHGQASTLAAEKRPDRSPLRTPVSFQAYADLAGRESDNVDPVKSNLSSPAFVPMRPSISVNKDAPPTTVPPSHEPAPQGSDEAAPEIREAQAPNNTDEASPVGFNGDSNEPDLPPLVQRSRRSSEASYSSTVIHGPGSDMGTSDFPEVSASPPLPREHLAPIRTDASPPMSPDMKTLDGADVRPHPEPRHPTRAMADPSPPSSPPFAQSQEFRSPSPFMGPLRDEDDEEFTSKSVLQPSSFIEEEDLEDSIPYTVDSPSKASEAGDDQLQQQISDILNSIPANIKLAGSPGKVNHLNPPPLELPTQRVKKGPKDPVRRSASSLSSRASTRASTPAFLLAPAYPKIPRPKRAGQQETKVYHLSRATGERPIKLLIRCVGEHGERVMVRVGGGWADLGEYLKEYASHHGRRSANPDSAARIEVRDLPRVSVPNRASTASPPSRPASALDYSPVTPLNIRKTRRSFGATSLAGEPTGAAASAAAFKPLPPPRTPAAQNETKANDTPPSDGSTRSRSSSHLSWAEEDSSLGLAGPTGRKVEMSEESRAWVESVKEKVRLASGERPKPPEEGRFGDMGRVGGTKRLFRKG